MPMSSSSFLVVPRMNAMSMRGPLRTSLPRKKLRQTGISGTTARSWYTVAMPWLSASRGEVKRTGWPSTS